MTREEKDKLFEYDESYLYQISWIDRMIEKLEKHKDRLHRRQLTLISRRKRKEAMRRTRGLRVN